MSAPHRSFLVSCLGAYDDSGLGTGGFVVVRDGGATIIDKIDSTGLCTGHGLVYRFARGLRSIVGYGPDGVRSMLRVPEAKDVHDIFLAGDEFVCVSTGSNEVIWIDFAGRVKRRWQGAGERDAWHLNCLCEKDGRLFVSAFARLPEHRAWVGKCKGMGFIADLETGEDVVPGLSGPHNPRWIDGDWVVCNSHTNSFFLQCADGTRKEIALGGFTRGLASDADFYYVGESADRKAAIPTDHSFVVTIDRRTHEIVDRIKVPFPEIYELLPIAPDYAGAIAAEPARFQIERTGERIAELENQVELGLKRIEELSFCLDDVGSYRAFKDRLTRLKRRLVG